ncbi:MULTISPECIES: type IV pilin protein [Pseudomonas]|uniref:Type IV pilus biogenesis protein PilE n=1 Tax=Pseudomonas chlororaphis subsp. aureofaciens TaxID=587851 RepID=A0AAD1E8G3_9PSED|nr:MULTISPECIES: type IV pilin protein [Pseudomonas]AZD94983.1 Type IV pilus biogenesis protein PilE [Pseudomonas chlororaphis subsp. aureofaciens]AZE01314.1 Type IV pilus biogenesis protein PilE [Pseudomonas chlororaphis subsp. aureofaciens]AZE07435.1 Type IV pilus biogenesis protein PilE [Pseudomonas chlororaphis subsp. aureofaciens]AZE25923.1 Type IV pilus biogenesis protein PilE [Pseudomonas chlororaphis subsp. aureofaciens]AZE32193.1 Type IV pilus biogenesis protein PilE [Pseudomonas chlo
MRRSNQGFTLIEIMIVIAIIGLVVTLSLPSITEYVKKTHRTQIAGLLSEQAQSLERFHSKGGVYSNASGLSAGNDDYSITPVLADQSFTLTATPKSESMMAGDKCGEFTLSHTGAMGNNNMADGVTSKDCWGR